MRIIVKSLRLLPFVIEIHEGMRILDVKEAIHKSTGILPRNQHVVLCGYVLPNCLKVVHLRLSDMQTIYFSAAQDPTRPPASAKSSTPPVDANQATTGSLCGAPQSILNLIAAICDPATRLRRLASSDNFMLIVESRVCSSRRLFALRLAAREAFDEMGRQSRLNAANTIGCPTVISSAPPAGPSTDPLPCCTLTLGRPGGRKLPESAAHMLRMVVSGELQRSITRPANLPAESREGEQQND
jgi:hypothetical protein